MKIFLETDRLILREILPSDAYSMLALDSNPNVLQYIGIQPITNLETCRKNIRYIRDQYEKNGIGRWAVIHKDTNEFVGWSGLKLVNDKIINGRQNFYDLGYRFLEEYWGQGFGYEAAQAIINYGFETLALTKISAYLDPKNMASRKILEKCGLRYIETFEENDIVYDWMEIEK